MDHRECIDKAILNPEGRFRPLMDVIAAVDVTAREKLANLKAWEADERAQQRAESEDMGEESIPICIESERRSRALRRSFQRTA